MVIEEILKVKQPKAFMLENVKNLCSHDRGRTFKVILESLDELDYEVFYQVIDGQNFVPQHRERILIVGFDRKHFGSDIHFDLIERMSKRCAFLENCSAIMGLKNVKVICKEAEKVSENEYDMITFRAFRPLDKRMIKTLLRIVKKGGFLCAYKAKIENITQEMNEIADIVPEYQIEKLKVPYLEDSQRNLVIIKK